MTGHYVTMTELHNDMTLDDVDDLNIVLRAEQLAKRRQAAAARRDD